MKINVIGTPYSGSIQYAINLAKDLNIPFFNEPFKFLDNSKEIQEGPVKVGGGLPPDCQCYVAHHTAEQYQRSSDIGQDHKLIFIDRQNRQAQMLLYVSAETLYEKYYTRYNIKYEAQPIEIAEVQIKNFKDEIDRFNLLASELSNGNILYYEEIKNRFDDKIYNPILKNLEFKNWNKIKESYSEIFKDKKTVLFIVQSEMTWNCFRGLYHELKNNEDYNPIVIIIPQVYDTGVVQQTQWKWTTEHSIKVLTEENIPFFNLISIGSAKQRVQYLKKLNPAYAFIATKDNWYIQSIFGLTCQSLSKNFKMVYVPYYGATIGDVEGIHTKGKGHIYYWKIVVDSPLYADLFLKENPNNSDRLINVGHPKIEEIYKIRNSQGHWPLENSQGKLKVIWAPHWSCPEFPDWNELGARPNRLTLGTFWQNCWDFYNYAKENQDKVQFVFRPHPLLQVHSKLHGYYDRYAEFVKKWSELPNVYNELAGLYNNTFAASDVLVTEGASFLTEYPIATGKPVILIQNNQGCKFNELGVLAQEYANKVTSFDEIKQLLDFPEKLKVGDSNIMINYLIPYKEETSKKIVSSIEAMLFDNPSILKEY
jgi:hypothetical protein